ncbi:Uncharacterised protein [Legionella busanensis]|uniref:DUF5658 domain-containing protein n=1 Tax=Legionella busanensis TaxID=190655 RepID=A0A378JNH4_9GAMM|nr:hypothetical protein [Legionella busanensis]STX52228.1 Uncharacterised protein [Legionella busanensis]
MVRQSLIYLVLSILGIFFTSYIHAFIVYTDIMYTHLYGKFSLFFQPSPLNIIISKVIFLVLIPVVIVGIIALLYKLITGKKMPYFIELTWLFWLVLMLCNIFIH